MNPKIQFLLYGLYVAIAWSLLGCGTKPVADGGGTDIGNPLTLTLIDSEKQPVAHASVKAIPSNSWLKNILAGNDVIYKSVLTDESGIAAFDSLPAGVYLVQADHPSGGVLAPELESTGDSFSEDSLVLKNYGSVSGTIIGKGAVAKSIFLSGSSYSASLESDGSFSISNVSQGTYRSFLLSDNSMWALGPFLDVRSSGNIQLSDSVSFNSVLIEGFEEPLTQMSVSALVEGNYLYSTQSAGTAKYEVASEGYQSSQSLFATLTPQGNYGIVGYFLGNRPNADSLWDFSQATGLSFYIKGRGRLNVSIESDAIEKLGFVKHYSADIQVPSDWQKLNISFDSLGIFPDANPSPSLSWLESATSIKRIEFNLVGIDTTEFWLDDLTLEGEDLSDMLD